MTDFNIDHFLNLADAAVVPNLPAGQRPNTNAAQQRLDTSTIQAAAILNAELLQDHRGHLQSPMLSAAGSVYGDDDEDDLESLLLTPLVTPSATPGASTAFQRLQLTGVTSMDLNNISATNSISNGASTFIPSSGTGSGSKSSMNPGRFTPYPQTTTVTNGDHAVTPADLMHMSLANGDNHNNLTARRFSGPITIPSATSIPTTVDTRNLIPVLDTRLNDGLLDAQTAIAIQNYHAIQQHQHQQQQQQLQMLKGTMEMRKVNHKIAEQRRRDSIKKCFDELKEMVPHIDERNPSRLYILQKSIIFITS